MNESTTTLLDPPHKRSGSHGPHLMKAAAIDRFGPPSALKIHLLPVPTPGPNQILIALHSAGVGVWDTEIRGGWWPSGKPKFPIVLGTDGAGIVAAKGSRVRRFAAGDRVWAHEFAPKAGFSAEFVAVDARHAGPVPRRLDLLHAGAAAATGLTAFQGIRDHLHVRRGETVLVFGASGSVGSLALQFAKQQGARVIGVARGREALALVRKLGADMAIDSAQELSEEIDAVLALAGGETLEDCLDRVRRRGRVAYPHGVEPAPRKRRSFRMIPFDVEAGPQHFARLNQAVDKHGLQVPLAAVYSLEQAARAHERVEKDQVLGRVSLRIRR